MKRIAILALAALMPATVSTQEALPWPAVAAGRLYLPFGLEWFQEGARERVKGYGEPRCGPEACSWMADRPEGTVMLGQAYHQGTLVGLTLEFVLIRDAGLHWRARVKELRELMGEEDWVVTFPEDPLMQIVIPDESFSAESKDTRIRVTYREGEHSVTVSLDIQAK